MPREALESLWDSYNLLGEGWGIDAADLSSIVGSTPFLMESVGRLYQFKYTYCQTGDYDIYIFCVYRCDGR